ncbi:BTB domain-containing protein [Mycena kentingensis (nom. inval.)]|nr:BTB domain-containing protein [Mycena kentingensis (nom. inval.)]
MSTERRPAKRARDEVSETPAITRSPDHWLEDGSIVLQAESTQFRIAKSTLANYSNVFRDMLSLRLPNDEPHVDGCPLVVLPGDSPVDWKYLLDAMNPKALFIKELPSLHQWAGILRLSKKYDIAAFRGSCVELFKSEYPSELYRFGARTFFFPVQEESNSAFRAHSVNFAREFGIYSILPCQRRCTPWHPHQEPKALSAPTFPS